MERHEGVDHGGHGDEGEETGGDAPNAITEVEEADGQAAEDDGEVQPAQKGALIGEEDLGFDSCGQGNALACRRLVVGQGSFPWDREGQRRAGKHTGSGLE